MSLRRPPGDRSAPRTIAKRFGIVEESEQQAPSTSEPREAVEPDREKWWENPERGGEVQ